MEAINEAIREGNLESFNQLLASYNVSDLTQNVESEDSLYMCIFQALADECPLGFHVAQIMCQILVNHSVPRPSSDILDNIKSTESYQACPRLLQLMSKLDSMISRPSSARPQFSPVHVTRPVANSNGSGYSRVEETQLVHIANELGIRFTTRRHLALKIIHSLRSKQS